MTSRLLKPSLGSPDYDGIRDALRRDTSVEVLAVRGLTVRVDTPPLFRKGDEHQAVRFSTDGKASPSPTASGTAGVGGRPHVPADLTLVLKDGDTTVDAGAATLFVPAPGRYTLEVRDRAGLVGAAPVTVPPQRKWTVFAVHHSHLDIGYTDPQGTVLRHHLDYLDAALRLTSETDGWPDDAQFRWTVESSLPALTWLAERPAESVKAFADRVRQGSIEVTAFPFQLHTEACSTEELYRLLRHTRDLRERYGIETRSAMHTDVPGAVVGVIDALNAAGVRYLAAAHNWAGRSVPYLVGGDRLTRPFRWRAPSGRELIVWFTDTPHGMAYMEGNTVGLVDGYDLAEDLLPRYLDSLANRPYPYGPGTFGWLGPDVPKAPYELDAVHLRVQGAHADNAGPSIVPAGIARDWNEKWAYPRLRTATNSDFFAHIEQHHGDDLPVHEGDWTDWWADGLGSGARPLGYVRRAENTLRAAETVHALAYARDGANDGQVPEALDAVYDKAALFNEHTWGAANPWEDAEEAHDSGGLQWTRKSAVGYAALDDAADLLQAGTARLGATFGTEGDALCSFVVVNPGPADRTDVVTAFLPRDVVPLDRPVALMDPRTGAKVPHHEEVVDPADWPSRPIGRNLEAVVTDVPSVGYVRLDVVPGAAAAPPSPAPAAPPDNVIENEFYRVDYDLGLGHIRSIFDKTAGRELVNADAAAGFGQYIYDRYATAPHFNHLSGHVPAADSTLLGDRAIAGGTVITKVERTPAGERLVVEATGKGVHWIRTTIELWHGVPRIDLRIQLAKKGTGAKEAVFFAFPFAADGPLEWELTGGVGGTDIARVPGSAEHMLPIRHWIAFGDPDLSVAWATLEAPLVQLGTIHMPYAPFPPTLDREPGTIYSWALNNIWDTNFPSQQRGDTTFRYSVASASGVPAHRLGVFAAAGLTDPLVAVLATGGRSAGSESRQLYRGQNARSPLELLVTSDEPDVLVTSVGRPRAGGDLVVRLRSLADGPVEAGLRIPGLRTAHESAGLEHDLRELPVRDGAVRVGLPARGVAAVVVTLEGEQ